MTQLKRIMALLLTLCLMAALCACKSDKQDVTGKYNVVSATMDGEDLGTDGEWIELKKGGKGTFYMGFEFTLKWALDGEKFTGTFSFLGMEETLEGTLKDGVLTVNYGEVTYVMAKDGAKVPEQPTASEPQPTDSGMSTAPAQQALNLDALRGGSMLEYLSTLGGASVPAGADKVDSGFVSPTTSIEPGSVWYGCLRKENSDGGEDDDIFALIGRTSEGYGYFEAYDSSDFTEEDIVLSMWIELYDDHFVADIGDQDAWIYSHYLTPADEKYFSPTLENGRLYMEFTYPENGEDVFVQICLREDGTPWDEMNDLLPPHYAEYKEAIGDTGAQGEPVPDDQMESQLQDGDWGLSVPDATGVVDFDTLQAGLTWIRERRKNDKEVTYFDIFEMLGVHGQKDDYFWKDDKHAYGWRTSDNSSIMMVTFTVLDDGTEEYSRVSWSGDLKAD